MVMEDAGLEFETFVADIDEKSIRGKTPEETALAIARAKSEALKDKINESAILVTADSIGVWKDRIIEKPRDRKEAAAFLRGYNEAPCKIVTAIVVRNLANGKSASAVDAGVVHFRRRSEEEIEREAADPHILDYAGGFTLISPARIDGDKGTERELLSHIERVEGSMDTILGLPVGVMNKLIFEIT
jgi:septum formation protein